MKQRFLLLLLLLFSPAVMATGGAVDSLRSWAHSALQGELRQARPNLNMLASLSLPLVTDVQRRNNADSLTLLEQMVRKIETLPSESLQCGEHAAIHLVSRFLKRINRGFDTKRNLQNLVECISSDSLFEMTNALIFYCGHTDLDHHSYLPGGLDRLVKAQQPDGVFLPEEGDAWYYLTSHALLAMHYCKSDRQRLELTRKALERHLPEFQKTEFIDGLAESLIYLRWTGMRATGEPSYIGYLRGRIAPDGGACFRHAKNCEKHWHPVGRLWQLMLETE